MNLPFAEIELINAGDIALARHRIIGDGEIKRMRLQILGNKGGRFLCINENIQAQLDLPYLEKRKVALADGSVEDYDIVGPVLLKFVNRQTVCNAMVLPNSNEPLLGTIPLGDLDVIIHPESQELVVNPVHPGYVLVKI